MTPFLGTRGRLRSATASLLVILTAEFLKWQDPVAAASVTIPWARRAQVTSMQESTLCTHYRINMQSP